MTNTPHSRFDQRLSTSAGLPSSELVATPSDWPDIDVPRFDGANVVALTPGGPYHHTVTGMLYAAANNPADSPIAECLIDGRVRRLRLPRPGQPQTIDQWTQREQSRRFETEQADDARRRKLQAGRRPVTLAFAEGVELPTVKAAHDYLADRELMIEVGEGRLRIDVDQSDDVPGFPGFGTSQVRNAAKVVYTAEVLVVAHLTRGEPLPDVDITPNGLPIR